MPDYEVIRSINDGDSHGYVSGDTVNPGPAFDRGTMEVIAEGTHVCSYWCLFEDVVIPDGANITEAYVEYYASAYKGVVYETIRADDNPNPSPYGNGSVFWTQRPLTTAYTEWDTPRTVWSWNRSPNIAGIIQELVNKYSYAGGANIQLFGISWPRRSGIDGRITYETFDGSTTRPARLHFEYSGEAEVWPTNVQATSFSVAWLSKPGAISYKVHVWG